MPLSEQRDDVKQTMPGTNLLF